jgi:peptidyl-prolyl cis-trans isomerase B (cyclophilin B)
MRIQRQKEVAMECPKCGKENPEGAGVCVKCGANLASSQPEGARRSLGRNLGVLLGVVVVVAVLAAAVWILGRQVGWWNGAEKAGDLTPEERNGMYSSPPPMTIDPTKSYQATIVTAKGRIVISLAAKDAPQTVNNLVYLARQGFYDNLTFHRVEHQSGFELIQGGDPLGRGNGGPGYTVPAEIGLLRDQGAIAMARLPDSANPDRASSGSQFYICLVPIHQLDGGYTVFGYVTEGLEVAQQIAVGDKITTIEVTEQ